LSSRLVAALPAVRIRSDVERKRLAGIDADEPASASVQQGIYSPQFSHRTYARLADCAERCLRAGFDVIVDAAFLDATDREAFQKLAQQLRAGFAIASCQADPITLASRILQRGREHADPSDATLAVLDSQLRNLQPFSANEQQYVIEVDTAQDTAVAQVRDGIAARRQPQG
jgi:predicted kinase